MDIFCRQSLEAHNKFRAAHNVPTLIWAADLARDAEAWAKMLADERKLKHDKLKEVGENVFMASKGFDIDGKEAVKSWYSEVEKYDFKTGGYQPGTGHFTQVVWKGTKELGVARAQGSDGSVFVVARYRPGGNDLDLFSENVLHKVSIGEETPAETTERPEVITEKYKPHLEDAAFIDAVLKLHNEYRSLHNAQRIEWSHALALQAQSWAEKLAREGTLHHASKEERMFKGENICRMSRHYDIGDVVRIWYSEIQDYDYNSPTFSLDTGHFTQIVWSNTSEIGVGTSQTPDGRLTYVVARYNPPGNILNKFAENVPPKVR